MYTFNAKQVKDQVVQWIRDWFEVNGKGCNAVIGISGGKDSSVVAGLCAEALGVDRVIGVTMPNGVQPDIDDSMKLINHLGIRHCCVNIGDTYNTLIAAVKEQLGTLDAEVSRQTTINLPPRLRMSTLYAVSQSMNGRVANTCNLSEDWVGYSTRYGDAAVLAARDTDDGIAAFSVHFKPIADPLHDLVFYLFCVECIHVLCLF